MLNSTVKLCCFASSTRRLSSSFRGSVASKATDQRKRVSRWRKILLSSDHSIGKREFSSEKEFRSESSLKDGHKGKGVVRKLQTMAHEPFGMQRMEKEEFDSKEQQVELGNLQKKPFLNAVVKVDCTWAQPDYSLPWLKQEQRTRSGSAFMIGDGKLLTVAYCVEHATQIKVKRRGDHINYIAKVLARGVDCDLALLSVEKKEFWEGLEPLNLGSLPQLQDSVTVVGYPIQGKTVSVTRGVVSRIEVSEYNRRSFDLLGIQIDGAIKSGNIGGPALNDHGECIGVACTTSRSKDGYLIPTTVVLHFLNDYERNKKHIGIPCLGVLWQKLENQALRECLKVKPGKGILVSRTEPTSDAHNVLKKGDVIVSFDDVRVGCGGTVPFLAIDRVKFRYLITQKFAGDVAELGIIRAGEFMKVKVVLNPRVHLVPYDIDEGQPSYLVIAGFVFTPLSKSLIQQEREYSFGSKLLAKAYNSLPRFKGEQIVILTEVLGDDINIGYEDMRNQQVLKLNGTRIKNIHHLTHLVDSCKDKYLVFEFEENIVVLEKEAITAASSSVLKEYDIPSERSADLLEPYVDSSVDYQASDHDYGDCPVSKWV